MISLKHESHDATLLLKILSRGGFLPRHDEDLRKPLVRRQGPPHPQPALPAYSMVCPVLCGGGDASAPFLTTRCGASPCFLGAWRELP